MEVKNVSAQADSTYISNKFSSLSKIISNQIGNKFLRLEDLYIGDEGLEFVKNFLIEKDMKIKSLFLRGNKLTGKSLTNLARIAE